MFSQLSLQGFLSHLCLLILYLVMLGTETKSSIHSRQALCQGVTPATLHKSDREGHLLVSAVSWNGTYLKQKKTYCCFFSCSINV